MAQASATKSQAQVALVQLAAQQAHERQKPFVEAQMKYYFEATETATQIARTTEGSAREKLIQRFWQLYWGPLAVVEDEEVEAAMVAYGQHLKKNPRDAASLETLSLAVAHACRGSLKRLWVPELGGIKNIRPPAE
jgi:homospermidine synthase